MNMHSCRVATVSIAAAACVQLQWMSSSPLFSNDGGLRLSLRSTAVIGRYFSNNSSNVDSTTREPIVKEAKEEVMKKKPFSNNSKPDTCTGDELHYLDVPGSKWKLALWRYHPLPSAPVRNHPVLLLSGVATNAIGFDLDPDVSFARYMASQGFDTWILEMRGAGLTKRDEDTHSESQPPTGTKVDEEEKNKILGKESLKVSTESAQESTANSSREFAESSDKQQEASAAESTESLLESKEAAISSSSSSWEIKTTASQLSATISQLRERLRSVVNDGQAMLVTTRVAEQISNILEDAQLSHRYNEVKDRLMGLLEERRSWAISSQLSDLSSRLSKLLEEAQLPLPRVNNLQSRLTSSFDDLQKFLDLVLMYDWDFDNYVEEDVPAAIGYIREQCQPKDGRIFGVGHSMGGIILYSLLASKGKESGLVAAVTVASSLDYSQSDTSLKMLLPLADPAKALNVPAIPLGAIMQSLYPLVAKPPYVLAWLGHNVSANGMMDPELFNKLVLNNFCTVPAKLILHLRTAFYPGGLRNRDGTSIYKNSLPNCTVPVLAIAGDHDLICPPSAVLDTLSSLPEDFRQYRLFGGDGKHYGHYDLLVARSAKSEVFPVILEFMEKYDIVQEEGGQN